MTQRIDTADFHFPKDLLDLMGVYETQDGRLVRAKFDGPLAPEQVAFKLKHPIDFGESQRWTDIDGNVTHGFRMPWGRNVARFLLPNNVPLRGIASVYPYSESIADRAHIVPSLCVDPENKSSWVWSVIDVYLAEGVAVVWQGDWDHCLNEFVNAPPKELATMQLEQIAEETDCRRRRQMNKTVTEHRDAKLAELDAEWRRKREHLLDQWSTVQHSMIQAEVATFYEEYIGCDMMFGLVLGANTDKTPLRKGLTKDVRKLMRKHEREHGDISATVYWTVKEDGGDLDGIWRKHSIYDATRGVWTLLYN